MPSSDELESKLAGHEDWVARGVDESAAAIGS